MKREGGKEKEKKKRKVEVQGTMNKQLKYASKMLRIKCRDSRWRDSQVLWMRRASRIVKRPSLG